MADFFGKIADGFNKGVATVSTGSKNMIEKSKINTCIKNLENEKKQLIELLGNKVYTYCKNIPDCDIPRDIVQSFCDEIDSRMAQVEMQKAKALELDAEMEQVKGTNVSNIAILCSCGHENASTSKFCAKCGTKLQ